MLPSRRICGNSALDAEWRTVRFNELLAEPVKNGVYKPKAFHGRGAKIVNMGELFAYPRLRPVPMRRLETSLTEIARFALRPGDLLFARRSLVAEGAGKCSIVLEVDEPTVFESSIIRARPDPRKAFPLYLYYYFNSRPGLQRLDTIRRQVAVAGITGTDLAALALTIPPIAEQQAIAHVLGTLDDKIELNARHSLTLERLLRAIFKSWFVDFDPVGESISPPTRPSNSLRGLFPDRFEVSELGAIPAGWSFAPISDIAVRVVEKVAEPALWQDEPLINLARMPERSIALTEWGRGAELTTAVTRFRKGDTLFGAIRPYFHKVGVAPFRGVTNTSVFVVRAKDPFDAAFVTALCSTDAVVDYATRVARGTKMPVVGWNDFASHRIPMPPRQIRHEFGRLTGSILDRVICNSTQSRTLAELRDTLLSRLILGEVRVGQAERMVEAVPG